MAFTWITCRARGLAFVGQDDAQSYHPVREPVMTFDFFHFPFFLYMLCHAIHDEACGDDEWLWT